MNWNIRLFFAINARVGRERWLDALGRAGAEWVVFAMLAWYGVGAAILYLPDRRALLTALIFLAAAWTVAWFISVLVGLIVREPRPHLPYPESRLLFQPLMSWKSFPSDHALSAWLIFFMALVFGLPAAWGLLPLALWVSWGRVYAGVHYPFDVVGGALVAALAALASYYVVVTVF
ncbi:MAG: phosphatase PAP2 family protein [Candidatus Magasanikbacteria bacterium]|nr:phosphatase PAP2 family protein [Candidatus Magasanikbacteria bacterium]